MKRAYADTIKGKVHYYFSGKGEPLMLIHHAGATGREFERVMSLLSDRFSMFAMDLPGHGGTDPCMTPQPMIRDIVDMVIAFLDAMTIEQACFAGIHTGAEISAAVAHEFPSRVRKLVLFGIQCRDQKSLEAMVPERFRMAEPVRPDGGHLMEAWAFQNMFAREGTPPETVHQRVVEQLHAGAHERACHRACFYQNAVSWERLPLIACPTLVLRGSKDMLREDAQTVAELIPDCALVDIEDADPFIATEMPDRYARELRAFLDQG